MDCWRKMRKFDLSLRSSRSSYFATFRHQLTILSKTDALDEEKWLNMLGTFVKDWLSWKALNLRKTLLMASSVRLKPLNCSRLPCVYAQETLTFLLTQKKTCVKNYVQKE